MTRSLARTLFRVTFPKHFLTTRDSFRPLRMMASFASSSKPIVYITRNIPPAGMRILESEDLELRQWRSDDPVPREELTANVKDADALFCLLTDRIDEELLTGANKKLAVVSTMSVGYDHVDVAACRRRNIPVGYTPGVLTEATAELTLGLLLATSRRLVEASAEVKSGGWGTWSPLWMCGSTLVGSTVGIVGLGRIGVAVARRLVPFGVSKIVYHGRAEKPEAEASIRGCGGTAAFVGDFDEFLGTCDFVVVTCALTSETRNLFDAHAFAIMKKTAVFINTSRGGLVDQNDLYAALRDGQIGAAGLDMTTPEPLPPDDPLSTLKNCVILPHIGSATNATRNAMSALAAKNPLVHRVE